MKYSCFWLLSFLFGHLLIANLLFEEDNFLNNEIAAHYFQQGIKLSEISPKEAVHSLQKSFLLSPNVYSLDYFLQMLELIGKKNEILDWMKEKIDIVNERNLIYDFILKGRIAYSAGDYNGAVQIYDQLLRYYPSFPEVVFLKAAVIEKLGRLTEALSLLSFVISICPIHTRAMLVAASIHQRYGDYEESFLFYEKGLKIYRLYGDIIEESGIFIIHEDYLKMKANLILAYFQKGAYNESIILAKELENEIKKNLNKLRIENESKTSTSLLSSAMLSQFLKTYNYSIISETLQLSKEKEEEGYDFSFLQDSLNAIEANRLIVQRSSCYWKDWEMLSINMLRNTLIHIDLDNKKYGPLLPFDTLLFPFSMEERLIVAHAVANSHHKNNLTIEQASYLSEESSEKEEKSGDRSAAVVIRKPLFSFSSQVKQSNDNKNCKEIRIGFMSYDFNDHPTAHLMEGFFLLIHQLRAKERNRNEKDQLRKDNICSFYSNLKVIVLSYSKHDSTYYHRMFIDNSDLYYDISLSSYDEVEKLLISLNLQILFEMQIHTLGNRMEIVNRNYFNNRYLSIPSSSSFSVLAPLSSNVSTFSSFSYSSNAMLVINYLVYPGTSGSVIFDYLFCDKYVVTVERSSLEYTEKLLIVPSTYQISYYSNDKLTENQRTFEKLLSSFFYSSLSTKQRFIKVFKIMRNHQLSLRKQYNLPIHRNAIIFSNFNKIDKIDPFTFHTWMNVSFDLYDFTMLLFLLFL
jgi:tetratricopeptide (TPR) repeat protein